jgi:hypothetical protein
MPDGVRGQYCVLALTDTQTISCAKEQTEKTVFKSVGANLKTVGFSLRTLYFRTAKLRKHMIQFNHAVGKHCRLI